LSLSKTTGPIERVASGVVLMEAFQGHFAYEMRMGGGIPQITLTGVPDDWRSIRRRAEVLAEYGLENWLSALLPVLDALVASAEGRADPAFWRSFFRYRSGSMGTELTGWILTLFPYLKRYMKRDEHVLEPNVFLDGWQQRYERAEPPRPGERHRTSYDGPSLGQCPSGLASAPVRCVDMRTGEVTPLRFVAGLLGITQAETTLALEPEFGWAVVVDERQ
jgi:hypothetical protein